MGWWGSRGAPALRIALAYVASVYTQNWAIFASQLEQERQRRKRNNANEKARRAFNDAQRDRLELVDITADMPRTLVLGRVRYVEGVRRRWSSGTNGEKLTMIVSFAGHEIDGFEQWYLDDVPVSIDGSGWVTPASLGSGSGYLTNTAGYAKGATSVTLTTGTGTFLAGDVFRIGDDPTFYVVSSTLSAPGALSFTPGLQRAIAASAVDVRLYSHPFCKVTREPRSIGRSGDGTITIESGYIAGSAYATWTQGSGDGTEQGSASVSVSGTTATISGVPGTADVVVYYQVSVTTSYVRIRPYLGTDSQNVGNDLAAEYPGKIRTTDRFAGIALAVFDFIFSPDVFPQGRPTPTAVFRGAKCYDPRKDSTVPGGSGAHRADTPSTWEFSESPPVCSLRYFMWRGGWGMVASRARLSDVQAAATICDPSTSFTVGGVTVSLPRYACGLVIPSDADKLQSMDSIIDTMAGRHAWVGGSWRMRAGEMGSSVFTIDQNWFGEATGQPEEGVSDEPWIKAAQSITGVQRTNRVTGSCIDRAQRYQMLPYPPVEDATLVASKGERADEFDYPGVSHVAHAQNLAKIEIRQAQASGGYDVAVGWQALLLEPLDVGTFNLPGWGISGKTLEVTQWSITPSLAFGLQLQEITAAIFSTTDALTGRDPAPDSTIRRPWDVEQLTGLSVTSGTAAVTDTSILQRVVVTWNAATQENIRQGGRVEVQYTPAADLLPTGDWPSWIEQGDSTKAVIPGLLAGRFYVWRARFVQTSPAVNGPWSVGLVRHQVAARRATTIFRQTTAPTGDVIEGDEWFDTDDGNAYYVRSGGAWVATPTGTGGLQPGAATEIVPVTATDVTATWTRGAVDSLTARITPVAQTSWTNTTGATVTVEADVSFGAVRTVGAGTVRINGGAGYTEVVTGNFADGDQLNYMIPAESFARYNKNHSLDVANGQTIWIAANVIIQTSFSTTTSAIAKDISLKLTIVKR